MLCYNVSASLLIYVKNDWNKRFHLKVSECQLLSSLHGWLRRSLFFTVQPLDLHVRLHRPPQRPDVAFPETCCPSSFYQLQEEGVLCKDGLCEHLKEVPGNGNNWTSPCHCNRSLLGLHERKRENFTLLSLCLPPFVLSGLWWGVLVQVSIQENAVLCQNLGVVSCLLYLMLFSHLSHKKGKILPTYLKYVIKVC